MEYAIQILTMKRYEWINIREKLSMEMMKKPVNEIQKQIDICDNHIRDLFIAINKLEKS